MSISKRKLVLIPVLVWSLSFAVAELAFRLLGQEPTNELAGLYEQFGVTYKHRPHVHADANWASGRFTVVTDSEGLRCRPEDAGRAATSPNDVVVIGDSQTYGQGLSYEDTLVGRLEAASRPEITIRNAAVGGHYLEDQFNLVHWLYDRGMRPKAVIVFMTPYLVATAGQESRVTVRSDGRIYSERIPWYRGLTIWLKTHTVTYAFMRNALRTFVPDLDPIAVGFFATKNEADEQARVLKSLGTFQQWLNERGITVFMVYTPLAMEVDFAPVAHAAEVEHVNVDREMPYRISQNVAAALHIGFYDLRPTLAQLAAARHPLCLYKDPHYNAATSRACGDEVWRAIQSRGILRTTVSVEQQNTENDGAAVAALHSRAIRHRQ